MQGASDTIEGSAMRAVTEIKYELLYHSARLSLNCDLNIAKICTLFDELMQQGIYFDEFLEMTWEHGKNLVQDEFCLVFKQSISVMGIPLFNHREKAKHHIIDYHLDRIVNKKYDVHTEAHELNTIFSGGSCDFERCGPAEVLCEKYYTYANAFDAERRTPEQQRLIDGILFREAKKAFKQCENM